MKNQNNRDIQSQAPAEHNRAILCMGTFALALMLGACGTEADTNLYPDITESQQGLSGQSCQYVCETETTCEDVQECEIVNRCVNVEKCGWNVYWYSFWWGSFPYYWYGCDSVRECSDVTECNTVNRCTDAEVCSEVCSLCTDFDAVDNAPTFSSPQEESFSSWFNRYLLNGEAFHMGHDTVIGAGQNATIIGKFDYGQFVHKDLESEAVQAYLFGTGMNDWSYLGRYETNSDGKINVPVAGLAEGHYQVKMVVMGDLTQADAYITVVKPGAKAVVFDIDETLTTDDREQILDYTGIESASARGGAADLVNAYIAKGYHPLFVTARTYWYAKGTRRWLANQLGVPQATLRTTLSNGTGLSNPAAYKTQVLEEVQAAGLEVVRAYGNATTDIEGFANAGISLSEIYIIGENAGAMGSQAIAGDDYSAHIATVLAATPDTGCTR